MRCWRYPVAAAVAVILSFCLSAAGADKKVEPVKASNEVVELTAFAHIGREAVKSVLGIDPAVDMIAVEVKLRPRGDNAVSILRDQFTLISRRDGQRTQALHPSQIAGPATLVVASSGPSGGGGVLGGRRGPIWGGIPGTGDRPRRIGGDDDGGGGGTPGGAKSSIETNNKDADSPVLAALKKKELPQAKVSETAEGLLYFLLEGKHKLKDIELLYKGPGGTLDLDFQK